LLDFDQIDSISNQNDYFLESNENKKYFSGTAEGKRIGGQGSSTVNTNFLDYLIPTRDQFGKLNIKPGFEYKDENASAKGWYFDNNREDKWNEDGSEKEGYKFLDMGLWKEELDLQKILGLDEKRKLKIETEIGTANAGVVLDRKAGTLAVGEQGTMVGNAVSTASEDKDRKDDRFFRFGVGVGEGGAARLHGGDTDKDGNKEYGFGFDAGIFSVDYKSEDPVKDLINFASSPLGKGSNDNDGKSNLTKELGVDKAIDRGIELADDGLDYVKDIDFKKKLNPSNWW
jgi:hypothetical protein